MNSSIFKKIILFLFATVFLILSITVLYFLAEKYFFDRLFYQKSVRHGYYNFWPTQVHDWDYLAEKFNFDHRHDELLKLVRVAQNDQAAKDYFKQENSNDTFKVALIGDSMFFGTGLRKKQAIGEILERKLNKEFIDSKVYNYSFSGDDALDNYVKYKLINEWLKPDLIVFQLMNNDLIFGQFTNYPFKEISYQLLSKNCQDKLLFPDSDRTINFNEDFSVLLNDYYDPSFNKETQNFCLLAEIIKEIDLKKTILLSYGCPRFFEDCSSGDHDYCLNEDIYARYLTLFPEDVKVVNTCGEAYLRVSKKEGHPSQATNELMAEKIFKVIQTDYLK